MFPTVRDRWNLFRFELLLLSSLMFTATNGVDPDCNFYQELAPGQTYHMYNEEYPNYYNGTHNCRWTAVSSKRMILTCPDIDIPQSPNCQSDALSIYYKPGTSPAVYCNKLQINSWETPSNSLTITLNTVYNTPGGRFYCTVKSTATQEECSCGRTNPSKIIDGVETGINEYPMMAGITRGNTKSITCGATIISSQYLLTSASCLVNHDTKALAVAVGEHDMRNDEETDATFFYKVESYVIHPDYSPSSWENDIAILKITGNIAFSNKVGPACLPFKHYSDDFDNSKVTMLGWGPTVYEAPTSMVLREATVNVINLSSCKDMYPSLNYTQICTDASKHDGCLNDNGGPLLWQDPATRRFVIVGIITTILCDITEGPSVNTRVSRYLNWILKITPDVRYCRAE